MTPEEERIVQRLEQAVSRLTDDRDKYKQWCEDYNDHYSIIVKSHYKLRIERDRLHEQVKQFEYDIAQRTAESESWEGCAEMWKQEYRRECEKVAALQLQVDELGKINDELKQQIDTVWQNYFDARHGG